MNFEALALQYIQCCWTRFDMADASDGADCISFFGVWRIQRQRRLRQAGCGQRTAFAAVEQVFVNAHCYIHAEF